MKTNWFQNVLDSIAERGRELLGLDSQDAGQQELYSLCQQLLAGEGEASGIALSQEILRSYQQLDNNDKLAFFYLLDELFQPDFEQIQAIMDRYQESHSAEDLIALSDAVEAPRQELFRRLNMAPQGTASLVALRADLLKQLRQHPSLKTVDADLKHLLSSWFNRGFLQLRSINWNSPAQVLEKLINYEAVHEIQGWEDLRRRLMKDRSCFAFFHPAMPDEPLIFVEVAFVKGLSSEVAGLIDPGAPELDPHQADTAIFYSINNTQAGLRGISFGNFLIKQVLNELAQSSPWIATSSTLSPIPTFRAALDKWLDSDDRTPQFAEFESVLEQHQTSLTDIASQLELDTKLNNKALLKIILQQYLRSDNTALAELLSELLSDLALSYLTYPHSKRKLSDPVAVFHLSNGARLERLNPFADMSEHGINNSYGVMVNYLYDLASVEGNHEAFVSKGKIMMSDTVAKRFKKLDRSWLV